MTDSERDEATYESVRRAVLERDGWRCQSCGRLANLEVHHLLFRSHTGPDTADNLITLCNSCHRASHGTGDEIKDREAKR